MFFDTENSIDILGHTDPHCSAVSALAELLVLIMVTANVNTNGFIEIACQGNTFANLNQ